MNGDDTPWHRALIKEYEASLDAGRSSTVKATDTAFQSVVALAVNGNPEALTWLTHYLRRMGKRDEEPTMDERIAHIQLLKSQTFDARDSIALDVRLGELLEEKRLMDPNRQARTLEDLEREAVFQLEAVMSSKRSGEKRQASANILTYVLGKIKAAKTSDILLNSVIPTIRRFTEEVIRVTEKRIPLSEVDAWRSEVLEQLGQLERTMAEIE